MTSSRMPAEDLTLAEVAARLRKSTRWLQSLLAEDKRRRPGDQRFQFHDYIGKTPVWTEPQFQLLRAAIKAENAKAGDAGAQPALRSSSVTATGTFTGRSSLKDAESAFAEVLGYRPSRNAMRKRTRSDAGSRRTSAANSPKSPGQVLTFRSPPRPLNRKRKRKRTLGRTTVKVIQEITAAFGLRRVGEILESEWSAFVDTRHAGNSSETRERFLNALLGFLSWCAKKPRRWGTVPVIDRDKEARNPRRRKKRTVTDLSPSLISFMLGHAAPHLAAQLWTEWSTGARVSSILHGCRLCDVILAEGREQITFHDTKNGETVTAVLHPRAAQAIRDYLKVRGRVHDREGKLFLTHWGKRYSENTEGTQNKTAFNAMKRRARKALRLSTFEKARQFLDRGDRDAAAELVASGRAAHRLIGRVTQHWFRHMLATRFRGDIKGAMEQGGWIDERSVMGYTLDAPEHRRKMVATFDDGLFSTPLTRDTADRKKG